MLPVIIRATWTKDKCYESVAMTLVTALYTLVKLSDIKAT